MQSSSSTYSTLEERVFINLIKRNLTMRRRHHLTDRKKQPMLSNPRVDKVIHGDT